MIPYNGEEKYIFVSYSHIDGVRIRTAMEKLYDDGYRFWFDEGIKAGEEWDNVVAEKLAHSAFFMAFLSESYFLSRACKDELKYASDKEIPIIPVFLDDTNDPQYLPAWAEMRIGRIKSLIAGSIGAFNELFFSSLYDVPGIQACISKEHGGAQASEKEKAGAKIEVVILELIQRGVCTSHDIAEATGYAPSMIRHYLRKMQHQGVICIDDLMKSKGRYVREENDFEKLKRLIRNKDTEAFADYYVSMMKQFHRTDYESVQQYLEDYTAMVPYRNLFLDVLNEGVNGTTAAEILEGLFNRLCSIHTFDPCRNSCSSDELDIFHVYLWELFVLTITYYFSRKQYTELHDILVHSYFLRSSALSDEIQAYNYTAFNYSSKKLDIIAAEKVKPEHGGKYYTVSGYLLCCCREYEKIYTKRSIAEADLLLFQVLQGLGLAGLKGTRKWFPRCYVYADVENSIWSRLGSRTYCEKIMPLFGASSIEDLKEAVNSCHYPEGIGYKDGYAELAPQIQDYIKLDDIGKLP